jgi:hypothetical protein
MNVKGKFTKYKMRRFFATFLKLWLSKVKQSRYRLGVAQRVPGS